MAIHSYDLERDFEWGYVHYHTQSRDRYAKSSTLRKFLAPIIDLKGSERILDVGCGIGTVGKLLGSYLKRGGEIIGIDTNPKLVAYGNEHWARRASIRLEVGDANDIHYPDMHFDVATSFGLLEFVTNPYRVLREMFRVLRHPKKIIVIHLDPKKYVVRPAFTEQDAFYWATVDGMEHLGVDLDLTRFHAFFDSKRTVKEEFTLTLEYKSHINKKFIELVETSFGQFLEPTSMVDEVVEFNYQFLKPLGWTRDKIRQIVDRRHSIPAFINHLKEHLGEEFYQSFPFQIYRVYVFD